MTMRQAGRIFRLDTAPPKVENFNDYIISAVRENDLTYFTYFLHHYESRLNKRVYRFLLTEGIDRYDPLRFLDYKLSCVLAMLECLQNYVPDKGADFLTYAHHFIGNALLDCRRQEEAGSFKSPDEYKSARGIAWLYNNSGKSAKEVIAEHAPLALPTYTRTAGFCSLEIPCLLLLTAHKTRLFCCRRKVSVRCGDSPFPAVITPLRGVAKGITH